MRLLNSSRLRPLSVLAAATLADPRWAAVVARDAAADGTFYYSVKTTGVYCRPSCAARQALRWLLVGGPGPLIADADVDVGAGPVPARAVVAELGRAENVIYTRSSRRLDVARARGVQHALMWAQYATATPPSRSQGTDH